MVDFAFQTVETTLQPVCPEFILEHEIIHIWVQGFAFDVAEFHSVPVYSFLQSVRFPLNSSCHGLASFLRQGGEETHGFTLWEEEVGNGKGREMGLEKEISSKELKQNKT